jgi:hypothetical protein
MNSMRRFCWTGFLTLVALSPAQVFAQRDGETKGAPQSAKVGKSETAQSFSFTPENLGPIYDSFGEAFDRHYSHFGVKPDIDWAGLRKKHRDRALAAKNADDLTTVLKELLEPFQDQHVFLMTGGKQTPTSRRTWNYNGNGRVLMSRLDRPVPCGKFAMVARTRAEGFGYFVMTNQSAAEPGAVRQAIDAIRSHKDAPGFIVDLRRANGGNERFAQEIAALFCAKDVAYARARYRSGPAHDAFGAPIDRVLKADPAGAPYTKPVICLIGPGCISSGEGFAKMMKALPNVTTVGLPTAGSSGNPRPIQLGGTGVTVWFSRWDDLLPDGSPIEGKGVEPSVRIEVPPETYRTEDPTLNRALELLREKTKP